MAGARKSLFRFAILILIIPVGLLLVLHFFGKNRMDVPTLQSLESCGLKKGSIQVLLSGVDFSSQQKNQLLRIDKNLKSKGMTLDNQVSECLGDTTAIVVVDKQNFLRGSYDLEQTEINRLFVELDILIMNENYGEGVSR